jgi:hypothetical protein
MKITTIEKFAAFTASFLMIGLCVGHAQIMNQLDFTMSQPFTVANTTLPEGSYTIRPVDGADSTVLEIASVTGHHSVMVEADTAQADAAQTGSHLVFNKYKNVLALSEIFPSGGNSGYQLAQGHPEKLASKTEKPTKQTVALNAK